jgi:signal transduction histidine kinase
VLAVVGVAGRLAADASNAVARPVDAFALALVGAAALSLAARRRWPLPVFTGAAVLTALYLTLGYPYGPIFFPFLVAGYTAARHLPLSRSAPAAVAALAILLVHLFTHQASIPGLLALVPVSAWVAAPFAIGVTVRVSREAAARARAEAVRQRVDAERLRVAQEVHDVVGHGLAAIKMQADVALHLLARRPEQAELALNVISRTSTEALDELRATLAVVRRDGSDGTRSPAPGLDRLEELRQRMADAGVQVRIDTDGDPGELPAAVQLAGYRVVQESLTNVLRHGEARIASVRIRYETGAVHIAVSNPISGAPGQGDGLGIPGMRERVTSLGGQLTAGPTPDGRFEVTARIPRGGHR